MISILHTTARSDRWQTIAKAWFDACDHPLDVEYVLTYEPSKVTTDFGSLGLDDLGHLPFNHCVVPCHSRPCAVDGYNYAADLANGDILLEGQDDLFPCEHWDTLIKESIPDTTKEVSLRVREYLDGVVAKIIPHPIITRPYFERYGYLFWPEYEAMFSDNEFTDVCERDGVLVDASSALTFYHRQAGNPDGPKHDEVNLKQLRYWTESENLYKERKSLGFPRDMTSLSPLGIDPGKVYIPRSLRSH